MGAADSAASIPLLSVNVEPGRRGRASRADKVLLWCFPWVVIFVRVPENFGYPWTGGKDKRARH
jgi:hypothetical protein